MPTDSAGLFGVLGGSGLVLAILGILGNAIVKRVRGATPYEALASRVSALEEASTRDARHIRILANGFDVQQRLIGRMVSEWGRGGVMPLLTEGDVATVELAKTLVTYGNVDENQNTHSKK